VNQLGMHERGAVVDEFGLDPAAVARVRPLMRLASDRYWRVSVRGIDELPETRPLLFAANRSGVLPYDGLLVAHEVEQAAGFRPRFLVADWLATLPFAQPGLARLGGVRACPENALRLLARGESVLAFPEGAKGATKIFAERYRVQRFARGGVVRLAIAAGVPLVPVAIVGGEEVHPILWKSRRLGRAIGLPFVPLTPTFPWLGPAGALPLPSKWSIRFGDPIETGARGREDVAPDLRVARLNEELRERIQEMVDEDRRARPGMFG